MKAEVIVSCSECQEEDIYCVECDTELDMHNTVILCDGRDHYHRSCYCEECMGSRTIIKGDREYECECVEEEREYQRELEADSIRTGGMI